jgi:hypothetical protein
MFLAIREEPPMRAALVWALVLGSLVFSVGGVAVVGQADGTAQSQAQPQTQAPVTPPAAQTPQMPKLSTAAPKECKPPQRLEVRTLPRPNPSHVQVFNTRGYNYVRPGEVQPSPTDDPVPPAAPAPAPN